MSDQLISEFSKVKLFDDSSHLTEDEKTILIEELDDNVLLYQTQCQSIYIKLSHVVRYDNAVSTILDLEVIDSNDMFEYNLQGCIYIRCPDGTNKLVFDVHRQLVSYGNKYYNLRDNTYYQADTIRITI